MPYAALMVHLDAAPSAHRRVHLAVHMANRFQAALIGIAGRSYVPTLMAEGLTIDSEETDCGQEELEAEAQPRRVRVVRWSIDAFPQEWRNLNLRDGRS